MITQNELSQYLDSLLEIQKYDDYGPNGLQIEGKKNISKIAFAVSATKESIENSVKMEADALIVHHGLFWKFHGPKTLTGAFYKRVSPLIKKDINLYAYHLPLDGHSDIGNAAAIGKFLALKNCTSFGDHKGMPTGIKGDFIKAIDPKKLSELLANILNHHILHSCPNDEKIKSIGIITGGANSHWKDCLQENLDAFLTGEMSEHDWHEAKEAGIHFYAGGHNATEQFGIQNLMNHLKKFFCNKNLDFIYLPSDNPA